MFLVFYVWTRLRDVRITYQTCYQMSFVQGLSQKFGISKRNYSRVFQSLLSQFSFNISNCKGKFKANNYTLSCLSDARLSSHMYCSHLFMMIFLLFCIASFVYGRSGRMKVNTNCSRYPQLFLFWLFYSKLNLSLEQQTYRLFIFKCSDQLSHHFRQFYTPFAFFKRKTWKNHRNTPRVH